MSKTPWIIIGVIVLAVIAGTAYASMNAGDKMMDKKAEEASGMEKKDAMQKESSVSAMDDKKAMMKSGTYEDYAPEKLARAETGDVVLFFHASWCPSCRGLGADIEMNRDAIPAGVSILKVDYDAESELKKKYGVTYQHTLVQVDANGALINKWSASPTLSSLVAEIK